MSSLKQIAEQAYLMVNGKPNGDAANQLIEWELAGQQILSAVCKIEYLQNNQDGGRVVDESWLRPVDLKATREDCNDLFSVCLPYPPMDLSRDIGIYWVGTKNNVTGNYVKVTRGQASQISGAGTKKRYMREGLKIIFLDGLLGEQEDIRVVMAVAGTIDCDEENVVPEDLAPIVITRLHQMFLPGKGVRQDKTNDGRDESKA